MNLIRIYKVLVVTVLLSVANMGLAVEGTWTRKADMPTARFGLTSSVVDGRIYAIGGGTRPGIDLRTVEEYDPAMDTWTRKADMPTARSMAAVSVVDAKIYVIGGGKPICSTVEQYDPATDTWTRKTDMPTVRAHLSTSVVNGKIYAIGGGSSGLRLATTEEYDPATDSWTKKADMPKARGAHSASVVNGRIYVIGGYHGGSLSTVEEYDPSTDTWTRKAGMPTARCFLSTCVVNGKIYAIGGCSHPYNSGTLSSVEVYDPAADMWTEMQNMPTSRKALATSAVNGKIYAIGGNSVPAFNTCISTVEEYDPHPFVVDFNGDEIVNFRDFSMLAQYWCQDQSPLVNHRLDYEDLAVLADCWLTEILPASLIARWKLDEAKGLIAHDSAGDHDGTLHGTPIWQPAGGIINGALELDGISDYVSTPFVVGAVDTPFSVFAWAKGGGPDQVILSQEGVPGVGWLATDPSDGSLITDYPGLLGRSLASQTVVTDGQWHRVGLVWDPPDRMLYIDDIEVASDKHPLLGGSDAGLYVGAGSDLAPGTFWSGLVDDVRVHDRAIVP